MTRPVLWIILGAGAIFVAAAITITITIAENRRAANEAVPPRPLNFVEEDQRGQEEGAKVLKDMYEEKKSTTPIHDVFSSDEATTTTQSK